MSHIKRARPEDLVVFAFSGHGIVDKSDLYLVPYDGDAGAAERETLISAAEIATWLASVDAGQIVIIIDACRSGAAAGKAFRAGPLGDRGLGQLVFDKRMRMITATDQDSQAIGAGRFGHSLLTEALIVEGLDEGKAATNEKAPLRDLFRYAVERVPQLFAERVPDAPVGGRAQRPVVFDFWRGADLILPQTADVSP